VSGAANIKPPDALSMHDLKICLQFLFSEHDQRPLVATEYLPGKRRRSAALQNASEKPAQIIPSFIRPV
jgi:hypothetical protein